MLRLTLATLALVAACAMIILEIVMRRVAFGLIGGTDEISGYVMAGVVSWAAGYALIERAHIRIDLLHRRLPVAGRAFLDVAALGALLSALPVPDPTRPPKPTLLAGDVPSPIDPPPGCAFHPRCPIAERGLCDRVRPELRELRPGHFVACHLAE